MFSLPDHVLRLLPISLDCYYTLPLVCKRLSAVFQAAPFHLSYQVDRAVAAHNSVSLCLFFEEYYGLTVSIIYAAQCGSVDLLKWLYLNRGCSSMVKYIDMGTAECPDESKALEILSGLISSIQSPTMETRYHKYIQTLLVADIFPA